MYEVPTSLKFTYVTLRVGNGFILVAVATSPSSRSCFVKVSKLGSAPDPHENMGNTVRNLSANCCGILKLNALALQKGPSFC